MSTLAVIDAWTDLEVRAALTETELAQIPVHPAGDLDEELRLLPENTYSTTNCTQWSATRPVCCC